MSEQFTTRRDYSRLCISLPALSETEAEQSGYPKEADRFEITTEPFLIGNEITASLTNFLLLRVQLSFNESFFTTMEFEE